jgi:hypothetical protein
LPKTTLILGKAIVQKAFDKIWREGLWYKLLINNINGKMLNVIQNIYKDIKSNIIFNNSKSDYFPCDNGIRQSEKQLTNVIGLKFLGSLLSPLFL